MSSHAPDTVVKVSAGSPVHGASSRPEPKPISSKPEPNPIEPELASPEACSLIWPPEPEYSDSVIETGDDGGGTSVRLSDARQPGSVHPHSAIVSLHSVCPVRHVESANVIGPHSPQTAVASSWYSASAMPAYCKVTLRTAASQIACVAP